MPVKKLEANITQSMVKEEVHVLKEILDDTTHKMVGDQVFEMIQGLVDLSMKEDYKQLENVVAQLSNDEMVVVSR